MKYALLLTLVALSNATPALAHVCGPQPAAPNDFIVSEIVCDQQGQPARKINRFRSNNGKSSEYVYRDGRVVESGIWTLEGLQTARMLFDYQPDGSYIRDTLNPVTGDLERREHLTGAPNADKPARRLREWRLKNTKPFAIDTFGEGDMITLRQLVGDDGKVARQFAFEYNPRGKNHARYLRAVKILDGAGKQLGHFRRDGEVSVEKMLRERGLGNTEVARLLAEYNRPKEGVLILDSGFDLRHPDLTHKVWKNPLEKLDGIDNDGNGWVDDIHGWNIGDGTNDINDRLLLPQVNEPISHGTHVASIAMKDVRNFAFMGYAGDMTNPRFLEKAKQEIAKHKVRFANMSFGWDDADEANSPLTPGSASSNALEDLIRESKGTLFVVAAGNNDRLLERFKTCEIPPCLQYPNLIKVGALNVADYSALERADRAEFSNYSEEFVDIFAPGDFVVAAGIGGLNIALSGTSMASPNALNILLRMAEKAPKLSIAELKDILMKTAYVPAKPLPCRSKGMVYPERALRVAELRQASPAESIDRLLLRAFAEGLVMKGEISILK